MQKTTVLIVGAGPTGLMAACQLAIYNIPFIIVEKAAGPTTQSRAIGIQARTVEIFSQMGIADRFLREGEKAKGANFVAEGKIVEHIPFTHLGEGMTQFDFLLMLEQSKTERLFIDFLKKHHKEVLWDTELVSFTQNKEGIQARIKAGTKEEEISADWIIGADGAHSIVRHTLGIPLAGKTYKQSLFVLDCKMTSFLPKDEISIAFSKSAFAAFFPMAQGRWRIVGEIPDSIIGKETITFEDVNKDFAQRLNLDITLSDPAWISLYRSHHRCVDTFHQDRWFLMGDASNIHSPVGAQGMNTGLQDAYNLVWKLAFVHQKKAKKTILDTYNEERIPVAKKLVQTTDRVFSLAISRNPFSILLRERIIPVFLDAAVRYKKSSQFVFKTISQIGINYHKSQLSDNASFGHFTQNTPLPGDRLLYILFPDNNPTKNIQNLIQPPTMTLLLFSDKEQSKKTVTEAIKSYGNVVTIIFLSSRENQELYDKLGIEKEGYYLVRPDMYIACRSSSVETNPLCAYLSRFFITA